MSLSRKRWSIGLVLIVGGLVASSPLAVLAKNELLNSSQETPQADTAADTTASPDEPPSGSGDSPVVLASLESAVAAMPQFKASALPEPLTADVVQDFAAADALRESGNLSDATQAFIAVIEADPDSPQAEAADRRLDYMVLALPEADLDAIESGLPPLESVSTNYGQTVFAQFYFNRALRLMESDPSRALGYITMARDLAWTIMQNDLDDPFKSKILEGYLTAADITGQGEQIRAHLSDYADTLAPCFTSWLIKAVVDGSEPTTDFVTTFESKDAIRRHFLRMAGDAEGAAAADFFTKARELSWQMLNGQPRDKPALYLAGSYLEASTALGERARAVEAMEEFLGSEQLSIMRWVVRYELAMDLVQPGRSAEETRLGFSHFETLIDEGSNDLLDPVINDTTVDEGVRGLVMCMSGHAYFGTNRLAEAKIHYEWVLDYYPRESHPGDSAEYSLVELLARDVTRDPEELAARFESFVDRNPSGSYSKTALLRSARIREANNNTESARATYERIVQNYPNSSSAREARDQLRELPAQ